MQRRRSSRPSCVGSTTSALWMRRSSSRIVRGLRPRSARAWPLLERFPEHIGQEADEDVGLHAVRPLMPHRANRQLALLDAKRRLRLGKLDVRAPDALGRPVDDIGAQDVAAFAPARPVVPLRTRAPLQAHAGGAASLGDELARVPPGGARVAFEEAAELALQRPHVQRATRVLHALGYSRQPFFDPAPEAVMHRPLLLAALDGADQEEGLVAVGPETLLGLDAVAHLAPVVRGRDLARPLPELALRGADQIAPARPAQPLHIVRAGHPPIHHPDALAGAEARLHRLTTLPDLPPVLPVPRN